MYRLIIKNGIKLLLVISKKIGAVFQEILIRCYSNTSESDELFNSNKPVILIFFKKFV